MPKGYDEMQFIDYLKKNKILILVTTVSALCAWGYSLTNFTRTIDEERMISRWENVRLWIGDGRYTIAFLRGLLPYENLPYYHTFLYIVILIITVLLLMFFLNSIIPDQLATLCTSALFVTMPVHIYYESFCTYCEEIAFAYLLTIVSIYFVYCWNLNGKRRDIGVAVCMEIIALGVYQGFVPVFILMTCVVLLLLVIKGAIDDRGNILKYVFSHVGVLLVSLTVSTLLSKTLKYVLKINQNYVDGYFRWGKDSLSVILYEIQNAVRGCCLYPTTHRGYITIPIANLILLIIFMWGLVQYKKHWILVILCSTGMCFSNLFFFITMGGYMPPRVMVAAPLYLASTFYILLLMCSRKEVRCLLTIFTAILVLYQSATAVKINQIAQNVQNYDITKLESISEDVAELGDGVIPEKPIAFTGISVDYSSPMNEGDSNMGYSYFSLGRNRLQDYFTINGYGYCWCNEQQIVEAEEHALDMPHWPEDGSIEECKDYIIINFDSYSNSK